jgi:hypothetical protein
MTYTVQEFVTNLSQAPFASFEKIQAAFDRLSYEDRETLKRVVSAVAAKRD